MKTSLLITLASLASALIGLTRTANRDGIDESCCQDDDMDEATASPVTARYDEVADFYAEGFPDRYDDSATEALLALTGAVEGLDVLDLACGHGPITRELARRGGQVFGVDIARRLVEMAKLSPVPILAEALGYSPATIERHATDSATAYARYVAARR
jgi:2-polyprenyl-3-methyl-5-hydroxy-6-metoxy-1,4-benzoquinol methylase